MAWRKMARLVLRPRLLMTKARRLALQTAASAKLVDRDPFGKTALAILNGKGYWACPSCGRTAERRERCCGHHMAHVPALDEAEERYPFVRGER